MKAARRECPRRDFTVVHPEHGPLPALCGCWRCRRCAGRKRDKLVRRARALRPDGMLTTTISDAWSGGIDASGPDALKFLQERERVWRQHIQRVLGGFAYLWVVEFGEKNHRAHRHYLVRWRRRALVAGFRRGVLPRWVLSRLQGFAKSAGLGRVDWVPCHDEAGAAIYAAKYVGKTIGAESEFPAGRRRFASNEPYEEPKEPGWFGVPLSIDVVRRLRETPLLPADWTGADDYRLRLISGPAPPAPAFSPTWRCENCGLRNPRMNDRCYHCAAAL